MSSHGVFIIIICKHKGYISKTHVVLVCGKYNTSVHRQEYSTKYYCWYCQLKLDYVCTSLQNESAETGMSLYSIQTSAD